ncbi:MAG TPA: hypothetical protein VIL88_17830 [Devosia sp.]|jgi:hypothetical protein|uniref:hypothetical protein n=1 Tax=Devosia sp. TaxID=1871048 RepID=UPI002F95BB4E
MPPPTKPKQEVRRQRVIDIGKALHGERFTAALAAGMGVSQVLVSHVVVGRRNVTDDFERALAAHIDAVMPSRMTALRKAAAARGAIGYEHGEQPSMTVTGGIPAGQTVEPAPEPDDDGPSFSP